MKARSHLRSNLLSRTHLEAATLSRLQNVLVLDLAYLLTCARDKSYVDGINQVVAIPSIRNYFRDLYAALINQLFCLALFGVLVLR